MTGFEVYTGCRVNRAMQCLSKFCGHLKKLHSYTNSPRQQSGSIRPVCFSRKLFRVYDDPSGKITYLR